MFSKFEIAGIGLSITAMIAALYLVTMSNTPVEETAQRASVGTVFVSEEGNPEENLRSAIIDAGDAAGNLERLIIDDVVFGTGETAKTGDIVSVHYIGTLPNGQEFDNSTKRGEPFSFTLGEGKVIKGWEEGILGMKKGGKRILVIPAALGYGEKGFGPIPGGAALVFSVELLDINP